MVSINADVNGYDWTVTGSSGTAAFGDGLYGGNDEQFLNLSRLGATYRIVGIEIDYQQTPLYGFGSQTPIVSVVDPIDTPPASRLASSFADLANYFSRSRTLQTHLSRCVRKLDYKQWLL